MQGLEVWYEVIFRILKSLLQSLKGNDGHQCARNSARNGVENIWTGTLKPLKLV